MEFSQCWQHFLIPKWLKPLHHKFYSQTLSLLFFFLLVVGTINYLLVQWLSTFLGLWPFNVVPRVAVTTNYNIILLLFHSYNFATAMNHKVTIWYANCGARDPQVENLFLWSTCKCIHQLCSRKSMRKKCEMHNQNIDAKNRFLAVDSCSKTETHGILAQEKRKDLAN